MQQHGSDFSCFCSQHQAAHTTCKNPLAPCNVTPLEAVGRPESWFLTRTSPIGRDNGRDRKREEAVAVDFVCVCDAAAAPAVDKNTNRTAQPSLCQRENALHCLIPMPKPQPAPAYGVLYPIEWGKLWRFVQIRHLGMRFHANRKRRNNPDLIHSSGRRYSMRNGTHETGP